MLKRMQILLVICCCCALGCASAGENTKKGAVAGGVIGAVAGGIIGHQSGHGWEGAAIGAAAGATTGGVIGNQKDKREAAADDSAPAAAAEKLSTMRIIEMSQDGVPDEIIIDEIQGTGATYSLSEDTVEYLRDQGVSDAVIDAMQVASQ